MGGGGGRQTCIGQLITGSEYTSRRNSQMHLTRFAFVIVAYFWFNLNRGKSHLFLVTPLSSDYLLISNMIYIPLVVQVTR